MTQTIAHRRYMRLFVPAMLFYVVSILGISFVKEQEVLPDQIFYGLAVIPALAILVWVWGHMRYITELDEYLRGLQVRAIMFGMAGIMVIATVWGLMEEMTDIVRIPIFYVVPGFYLIYGIAHTILIKREGSCR
jgi:amino acid permease